MEAYVSPACTFEAVVDEIDWSWMPIDWLTVAANVMISVGMVIASRRGD